MNTLNYYRLFADYVTNDKFYGKMGITKYDGSKEDCFNNGVEPYLYKNSTSSYPANVNQVLAGLNKQYGGVIFGTGNTPPSVTDYKLAGDVVSTISAGVIVNFSLDDSGFWVEATYTLTNTGSDTVTIREVGLLAATSGSGESSKVLVERTVLDNPVTIGPAGVGQVVYKIGMNFPTA